MNRKKPNILVGVLDWGLGHATRCIPIIETLQNEGCNVIIGSAGDAMTLLNIEFPHITKIQLPAYQPYYAHHGNMTWAMLKQMPKFYRTVQREHAQLQKIASQYRLNAVISDNRYGLQVEGLPCVLVTHQLKVRVPHDILLENWMAQRVLQRYFKKFTELWVPDFEGSENLSGALSHDTPYDPVFIGLLSRMKKGTTDILYDLLILLSGPEPQRSIFEDLVLRQLSGFSGKAFLVRGITGSSHHHLPCNPNLEVKSLLTTEALNRLMNQSKLIICRSGYSTVMDLLKLQKSAILVPTPGQTEQEYLAQYLSEKGYFRYLEQDQISGDLWSTCPVKLRLQDLPDETPLLRNAIRSFKKKYLRW